MQVLKTKNNPWTVEQRQVIAEIVNEALTLSLDAAAIVGAITNESKVLVIWNYGVERYTFWFDLNWFKSRVAHKLRELEVTKAATARGLTVEPAIGKEKVFVISSRNQFIGCIGFNKGWYVVRGGGNGRPIPVNSVCDAVLSLWMLEVAIVA